MRRFVLLIGALGTVLLLFIALMEGARQKTPMPATAPLSHVDGGRAERYAPATEVAALEERLAAVEARLRSQAERQPLVSRPRLLTKDEFEQNYGGFVRTIVEEAQRRQAEDEVDRGVREYVRGRVWFFTRQNDLDAQQADELFALLVRIKREAMEIEERLAPDNVAPHPESPEHELWTDAWQRLVAEWSRQVRAIHPFSEKMTEEIVLDMASPKLRPRFP